MVRGAYAGTGSIVDLIHDPKALLDAQRRGLEAFMAAGQIIADGYRACAERQLDLVQAASRELWAELERTAGEPREADPALLLDRFRIGFERSVANVRELSDILLKAQGEAFEVLSAYVTDTFDEVGTADRTVVAAANQGAATVVQPAVAKAPEPAAPAPVPTPAVVAPGASEVAKATDASRPVEAEKPAEEGTRKPKRAAAASDAA